MSAKLYQNETWLKKRIQIEEDEREHTQRK
jgi:hypothetical protein